MIRSPNVRIACLCTVLVALRRGARRNTCTDRLGEHRIDGNNRAAVHFDPVDRRTRSIALKPLVLQCPMAGAYLTPNRRITKN